MMKYARGQCSFRWIPTENEVASVPSELKMSILYIFFFVWFNVVGVHRIGSFNAVSMRRVMLPCELKNVLIEYCLLISSWLFNTMMYTFFSVRLNVLGLYVVTNNYELHVVFCCKLKHAGLICSVKLPERIQLWFRNPNSCVAYLG